MKNGSSSFECFSCDIDGGYAATDDGVAFKYSDFGGWSEVGRVFADEMGDGGAADAGSDDADGG